MIVRQGKGRKDRLIPIGARALAWLDRYVREVRPGYVVEPDDGRLFLSHWGGPLSPNNLCSLVVPPRPRLGTDARRRVPSLPARHGDA